MLNSSSKKLVVAVGGLALSLTAGIGVASADPIVDTTCSYPQVMAALNTENPALAQKFSANPLAAAMLGNFLAAPPGERVQLCSGISIHIVGPEIFWGHGVDRQHLQQLLISAYAAEPAGYGRCGDLVGWAPALADSRLVGRPWRFLGAGREDFYLGRSHCPKSGRKDQVHIHAGFRPG